MHTGMATCSFRTGITISTVGFEDIEEDNINVRIMWMIVTMNVILGCIVCVREDKYLTYTVHTHSLANNNFTWDWTNDICDYNITYTLRNNNFCRFPTQR